MVISNTAKEIGGVLVTLTLLATGITVLAQNDSTDTSVQVQGGTQTIYAGDSSDNNDVCSAEDNSANREVEGIDCGSFESSFSLPSIFIRPNRQNPTATLHDVVVEDLRGFGGARYTVTAEVDDFVATNNQRIDLGSNPDGYGSRDVGAITGIVVDNGGTGYTGNTTVTISAPSGTSGARAAQAVPVIEDGAIVAINITDNGQGYQDSDTPTVTISGSGTGASATAYFIPEDDNISLGTVDSIEVTAGGTNYDNPIVQISSPATGVTATAYAVTDAGGSITDIYVNNPGEGYESAPTVTIFDNGDVGSGATATATVTPEGLPQTNVFATIDPSNGELSRLAPATGNMDDFQTGARTFVTSPNTQQTLFYTTQITEPGRFEIDNVDFSIRIPAFVSAGEYRSTITQTVIN